MKKDPIGYRKNVGVILMRPDGLILMAERLDKAGAWQLPQGGVDRGEDLESAMWRELEEELGLSPPQSLCEVLGRGPEVCYDFPPDFKGGITKRFAGQAQTLFLLRFNGSDADIDLTADKHPEFRAISWRRPEEAVSLLWEVKRPVLEATIAALSAHFAPATRNHRN